MTGTQTTDTTSNTTESSANGQLGNGRTIDFRKDTPPTDWLMKHVEERYGHLPAADIKISSDYLAEFITELGELRCEPACANGQVDIGATTATNANGRLVPDCICSLVEQLASPDVDLVVPKDEFVSVVRATGYSQKDALEHYRNYAEAKLWDKNGPEIERLCTESMNAHNWWLELDSDEAYSQSMAAENELEALERKMEQELEAIMSA